MKELIKSKSIDALATFIGSFIGMYIYNKTLPHIESLLNSMEFGEGTISNILGVMFSFFISAGFMFVLFLFLVIRSLSSTLGRPMIRVDFFDIKGKNTYDLDFRESPQESQYLNISFMAKFSAIQLWFLRDILRAKIFIMVNPKMCAFELAEGFVANSEDYSSRGQSLYFDIFSKYSPSDKVKAINTEVNLLLVHSAEGEIKFGLDLSDSCLFVKHTCMHYCKFEIKDFSIKG
jgi:hypothetical protein